MISNAFLQFLCVALYFWCRGVISKPRRRVLCAGWLPLRRTERQRDRTHTHGNTHSQAEGSEERETEDMVVSVPVPPWARFAVAASDTL
jgi:hypothetical protein